MEHNTETTMKTVGRTSKKIECNAWEKVWLVKMFRVSLLANILRNVIKVE